MRLIKMDDCSKPVVKKWSNSNGKRLTLREAKEEMRKLVERAQQITLLLEMSARDAGTQARIIHQT